jgi:hypothetical protein
VLGSTSPTHRVSLQFERPLVRRLLEIDQYHQRLVVAAKIYVSTRRIFIAEFAIDLFDHSGALSFRARLYQGFKLERGAGGLHDSYHLIAREVMAGAVELMIRDKCRRSITDMLGALAAITAISYRATVN